MPDFSRRAVLVSGAASGLGRGTALAFAAAGAAVGCLDIDDHGLRDAVDEIRAAGGRAVAAAADVTDSAAVSRAVRAISAGIGPVDVLINVAGGATIGSVHELADAEWSACLARNLTGTFYLCREVVLSMVERGHGVIVNTSSSLARIAAPRFAAYSAAKAGVRALTMQMARDYGPAVRVNCVSPAATDTPSVNAAIAGSADPEATRAEIVNGNTIARRLATVDEIVSGILFAASDEASFMTGHDLVLCGGQTIVAY